MRLRVAFRQRRGSGALPCTCALATRVPSSRCLFRPFAHLVTGLLVLFLCIVRVRICWVPACYWNVVRNEAARVRALSLRSRWCRLRHRRFSVNGAQSPCCFSGCSWCHGSAAAAWATARGCRLRLLLQVLHVFTLAFRFDPFRVHFRRRCDTGAELQSFPCDIQGSQYHVLNCFCTLVKTRRAVDAWVPLRTLGPAPRVSARCWAAHLLSPAPFALSSALST